MLNVNIVSSKSNVDKIVNNLDNSILNAVEKVLQEGQQIALQNKRGDKSDKLIQYEVNKTNLGAEGRIYTTFDYAPFLEYGTGYKSDGTLPHIGVTKTFKASGMRYWYLPKRIADASGISFNPDRIVIIKGEEFYIMYASKPYPFMRPTAFTLETKAVDIFKNELLKSIKE